MRQLLLYCTAVLAGAVMACIGAPLPWLIGSMLIAAAMSLGGWVAPSPRYMRTAGQTIVATAIGLYFTPSAMAEVAAQAPYMIGAALYTIVAGCVAALLLARLTHVEGPTSLFASVPGGPMEMAQMAERAGGDGAAVALAQTFRIATIVLIIPPVLLWTNASVAPDRILPEGEVEPLGLAVLYLMTTITGLAARRVGLVSPFFLGPLAATAIFGGFGFQLPTIPLPLLAAGQVLLGVSLGTRFDRALLARAPRFLLAAAATTVFLVASCVLLAWGIAAVTDLPFTAMVLATAPGSVTEMTITAQSMQLSVALVSAFHVVRMFIILPLTPAMLRVLQRRHTPPARTPAAMRDD